MMIGMLNFPSSFFVNQTTCWKGRRTVNADAHSTAGLGLLSWGLSMARRAWLTPEDVIKPTPSPNRDVTCALPDFIFAGIDLTLYGPRPSLLIVKRTSPADRMTKEQNTASINVGNSV